jgi:geranylgeranyl pyrophosphate synthase
VLGEYSEALGIAYQIRDDLDDLAASRRGGEMPEARPTLPWSLLLEKAGKKRREEVARAWYGDGGDPREIWELADELGVEERARELMEAYKEEATRVLRRLDNANVKGLLRRTVGKIFNDLEIKGWCHEFEARNAPGLEARAALVG